MHLLTVRYVFIINLPKKLYIYRMQNKHLISTLILLTLIVGVQMVLHPEAKLPFLDYCRYFRYPTQTHKVITEDGYILTLYRIQKKGSTIKEGLKPVFLQHGLLDSSDTWIINDEDKAPGFMLANRGYDVWFGNSRGNKHSRNHTKYNPDKNKQYWEFTFQHMADYDLPAVFTYVNKITKQKVNYIGHSQGTVQMHIALSKRNPVVQSLIDKYFGFGPVATVKNADSSFVSFLDKSGLIQWFKFRNIHEVFSTLNWFESDAGIVFCSAYPKICGDAIGQICDADPDLDNYERYDVLVGHDPSGTSLMNMEHWKQAYDWGKFQAFDYGSAALNNQHYGQSTPPSWDLSKIRVPIRLFAGASDRLADPTDVASLWNALSPDAKSFFKTYNSGHATFLWGKEVSAWMNDVFRMLQE